MKNIRIITTSLLAVCFLVCPVIAENDKGQTKCAIKNIIVMISDGCGYYHNEAANIYQYGKKASPLYAQFPVRCSMATFCAGGSYEPSLAWKTFDYYKKGYTDSAAAATAMSCGVKTYRGAIGVNPDKKTLMNVVERCEQIGKATGVITSVQFSHATPAGFAAHNESRNNYEEIAKQMITESAVDCIMGCGHPYYNTDGEFTESSTTFKYVGGESTWEALTAGSVGADADGDGDDDPWTLIQSREEFQALAEGDAPKRLCGVPQVSRTLQQGRDGDGDVEPFAVPLIESVPTLEEMTKAALNVLDADPDGFFIMIEGGAIDWASHANQSGRMIEEQIDFDKAVEAVLNWVNKNSNWDETLLIVTADHECGYLTGPDSGEKENGPVWNDIKNNGKQKQPGMEWHNDNHTNSLVPFYAKGRSSKLFEKKIVGKDTVRGEYIDNTSMAKVVFELLK